MRKVEKWVYAELEKSSISSFKMTPLAVMIFEPQNRFTAVRMINVQSGSPTTPGNGLLVVSEITLPHLSAATKWEVPASFKII